MLFIFLGVLQNIIEADKICDLEVILCVSNTEYFWTAHDTKQHYLMSW